MKIDVIITAYNAEDTIERTLQSCVNQVRKPDNVIVVDDCSQDSTYEKVRSFNDVLIHKLPVNLGCGLAKRIGILLPADRRIVKNRFQLFPFFPFGNFFNVAEKIYSPPHHRKCMILLSNHIFPVYFFAEIFLHGKPSYKGYSIGSIRII